MEESERSTRRTLDRRHLALTIGIILFFIVLAVIITRPLITRAAGATVEHVSDPQFQAWTLAWDIRAVLNNPLNLFNANIFFPNQYTLAYSDHQIVNAILAMPLMGVTHNPIQVHNYMLILNFFLCSIGAYLLAVRLTGNRIAGMVAGIAFAYAPYKLAHVAHLNLCSCGWIPLTLLFLHRYWQGRSKRDALLAALFFTLQVLTTWHYGIMLAITVLLFLLVALIRDRKAFTLKWIGFLAVAFVCAFVVILPFALPYLRLRNENPDFERSVDEAEYFSADISDFLTAPAESLVWGGVSSGLREDMEIVGERAEEMERTIFPGLIPLLLGVGGIVYLFRKGRGEDRFSLWFYFPLGLLSFLLCLGPTLFFFGRKLNIPMPYEAFFYLFPGFKAMRVPPRFAIFMALALAVFAAYCVRGLLSWLKENRDHRTVVAVTLFILALLVVDLMSTSIPMRKIPPRNEFPPVYAWLLEQEGNAPTAELPMPPIKEETNRWLELNSMRTYYSTLHWKDIFNGYSGYIPGTIYQASELCRGLSMEDCLEYFKEEGIEYLILHGGEMNPSEMDAVNRWEEERDDVDFVRSFGSDHVYRLNGDG